ncbi:FAD-binding oxidoreductase [Flavihumibacter stibioxidans]|uniref:Oxidoreductase n=1 Tax=Flavihumibacter stibioxidans TaxID=1834163 RepID=A0ABR7M8L0_9BACT|nr:FAD-binding oxidoreductase [Flavihumibacter stibioxidans]MBC6491302.1 oxidoreductase [Flavihumibacter stibioxidans]
MPDPKFLKPWHGISREEIKWNPAIDVDACIGCGTCVTGCSRLVYRYDYEKRKPVVVDPLNCMVGCTTCSNTCPTHAIHFPSISTIFALEAKPGVHHSIEDELIARQEQLAFAESIPHPDRVLNMKVAEMNTINNRTIIIKLTPVLPGDCFCQFIPGQYVEIIPPGGKWLPRAYSIGNAPQTDGSIELQIRHTEEGRLSNWLFKELIKGDILQVRGPRGGFTMKSSPDKALIFVAGGTGFAPVKALIEQQLLLDKTRRIELYWGVASAEDLYETETLIRWKNVAPNFNCILAIDHGNLPVLPEGILVYPGRLANVISDNSKGLPETDAYVAGPPVMMPGIMQTLMNKGIGSENIHVDSFGL